MNSLKYLIACVCVAFAFCQCECLGQASTQQLATLSTALNFKSLQPGQEAVLAISVDIRTGYHAQSHTPKDPNLIPFTVTMESSPQVEWTEPVYPPGQIESYPALGIISVYNGKVIVYVPFKVKSDLPAGTNIQLKGSVRFQICNDRTCYAPQTRTITLEAPAIAAGGAPEPANPELFKDYHPGAAPTSSPTTQAASSDNVAPNDPIISPRQIPKVAWSALSAFGAALLAGLLFNVMPCVLPVLPLKAVGFYEAAQHDRSRAFMLGLVFSAGIVAVFALLAPLVVVFKAFAWGDLFSYGWFVWGMVILLVFLGAGLLGGWNLSLPLGIYTFEPRHDTYSGSFFWGVLSAVLATPCTAPLLPPVLLWATQHSAAVGVSVVIMVGVGMALPYLVLSAVPELAKRFPRTGPWSEVFKQMMGFLLLASAAYFGAGRIISGPKFWWVVTAVIGAAAVFLVVRSAQLAPRMRPVLISFCIAAAMFGSTIRWTYSITSGEENWESFSTARFNELRSSGKPVLVKFTANWCATCQVVEGTVFHDPVIWRTIKGEGVTAMKVDLTLDDAPGKDLLLSLNPSGGIPLTAVWGGSASGQPVVLESIYTSKDLLNVLDQVRSDLPGATRTGGSPVGKLEQPGLPSDRPLLPSVRPKAGV